MYTVSHQHHSIYPQLTHLQGVRKWKNDDDMILIEVEERDNYAGRWRGNRHFDDTSTSASKSSRMKGREWRRTLKRGKTTRGKSVKKIVSRSVIDVTDSVTGGKMMKKKKRVQTERGSAGCCQMKTATASNQPITVR